MVLRYASDCSGVDAPCEALSMLGVPFRHVFASESNRTARKWLEARWSPQEMFTDVTRRDHGKAPRVDLYCFGPPCV